MTYNSGLHLQRPLPDESIDVRSLPVAAAVTLGASLFAQTIAPLPGKTDDHSALLCVVAGRVVTASDGTPLKSARVALVPEHPGSRRQMYAATTDNDGRFLLKDIKEGRYEFFATRPGFVDQHYQAKGGEKGATLSLKPGDKVKDVLFRMTVAAVLTGRVTNDDGEALVRAQVVALRAPSEDEIEDDVLLASRKEPLVPVSSAQTDDRGQYRIFGLKPGEYYIQATDSSQPDFVGPIDESYRVQEFLGSEYASAYYPGVFQLSQAQSVSLKPGEEAQADIPLRRVKTVEISGHVLGRNGPAKDAWVSLEQPEEAIVVMSHQDSTDEKDSFRPKGVTPGSYSLVVYQRREHEDVYEPQARQKIEVNGENIDSLTILLGLGATVRGRVLATGAGSPPLDRIYVGLQSVDDGQQFGASERLRKGGTFEIPAVQDGNYSVQVSGLQDNWYVKSIRLGASDIIAEGLQLEKGAAAGTLEVTLSSASAELEGSVGDDDGAVIGAKVRLMPDPENPYNRFRTRRTRTDQGGHFSLAGLAPGKYRVFAQSPISSEGKSYRSEPKTITLTEGDHKALSVVLVKPPD